MNLSVTASGKSPQSLHLPESLKLRECIIAIYRTPAGTARKASSAKNSIRTDIRNQKLMLQCRVPQRRGKQSRWKRYQEKRQNKHAIALKICRSNTLYRYVHIFQSNAASKPKSQSFKSTIHGAVPSTEYLIQFPTNQPDKLNKFPRIQPKSSNNESLHSNFQHKRIIANGTSKSARESTKHNSKTHSSRNAASALTTPTDFFRNYSVKRTFHRS